MACIENKPDIIQAFDVFRDREYYKLAPGFFFSKEILVRVDSRKIRSVWKMICENLPDVFMVNGVEYKLVKKK